jgi:hypothetical protein
MRPAAAWWRRAQPVGVWVCGDGARRAAHSWWRWGRRQRGTVNRASAVAVSAAHTRPHNKRQHLWEASPSLCQAGSMCGAPLAAD